MKETTARELIANADRHHATERAAESARVKIRLGEKPVMHRGLLGFRSSTAHRELFFSVEETHAIYAALAKVASENHESARGYDARVTIITESVA